MASLQTSTADEARWLASASALARAGRLEEAEQLLAGLPDADRSLRILQLRARIAAQDGRTEEARKFWQTCSALEPDEPSHKEALERLQRVWWRRSPWVPVAVVLVAVVMAVVAAVLAGTKRPPKAAMPPSPSPLPTVTRVQPSLPEPGLKIGGLVRINHFKVGVQGAAWTIKPAGRFDARDLPGLAKSLRDLGLPLDIVIQNFNPRQAVRAADTFLQYPHLTSYVAIGAARPGMNPEFIVSPHQERTGAP